MKIPDSIIDKLAEQVASKILERAESDWQDFCDEGHFSFDLNAEIWQVIGELNRYPGLQKLLVERLEEHPSLLTIERETERIVTEIAIDSAEWEKANKSVGAMLRYHGLSVRDFI